MSLAIGIILCAVAIYSLVAIAGVLDVMSTVDIIITTTTQLLFLGIGGYLIKSYFTSTKK